MIFERRAMSAYLLGMLLMLTLSVGIAVNAQSDPVERITVGDTVGGFFGVDGSASWQVAVPSHTILELTMRRIGGVYTPRMTIETGEGVLIPATVIASAGTVTLVVDEGVPASDDLDYVVRVFADDDRSDGVNVVSEYSLTLASQGVARADSEAGLPNVFAEPLVQVVNTDAEDPAQLSADSPFSGDVSTLPSLPNVSLYGDINVLSTDPRSASRFVIGNAQRTIAVDNTLALSVFVEAIALTDDNVIWMQMVSGAVFSTDLDIISLLRDSDERDLLTIILTDGREIRSDFAQLQQINTRDALLEVRFGLANRMVLDSTVIRLTTTDDEVSTLVADEATINTDKRGWDVLAILQNIAWVRIDDALQVRSDVLNFDLFQRETDARYTMTLNIFDRAIDLRLDTVGMANLNITARLLTLTMLDERTIEEGLFTLSSLDTDARSIRVAREDGTAQVILPDDTQISLPDAVPAPNDDALPDEAGFSPQHFNNLGTTVSDYHPRWDTDASVMPVNRVIGNLVYPVTDFALDGDGVMLGWSRTYNSLLPENSIPPYLQTAPLGTFGDGWTHHYQMLLDVTYATHADTPQLRLYLPDGSQHIFTPTDNDPSLFRSAILRSWTLVKLGNVIGTWEARTSEGAVYRFDEAGRLVAMHDAQRDALVFSPVPRDRLIRYNAVGGFFVTDGYGRRIELYTNADNLIIAMRDVQGRDLRYDYDDNSRLSQVTYRGTQGTASYTYDADGRIIALTDAQSPYHPQMTFAYNERGKIDTWTLVGDDSLSITHTLTYQTEGDIRQTTQTHSGAPERIQSWTFDTSFRLRSATTDTSEGMFTYFYEGDSLTRVEMPNSTSMLLTYNNRGYLTTINDPLSSQDYTLTYEETTANQVRLLSISVPNVDIPYMQLQYDDLGRLSAIERAITNTATTTTRYVYADPRYLYHLTEIFYGAESDDPVLRRYRYDDFGYVSHVEVGRTSALEVGEAAQRWSVVHDITGRLRLVTDGNGVTTSIGWDDAVGEIASITVDDTVVDTQYAYLYDYDSAGNLVAITEPENIITRYSYDALNRVIEITEPLTISTDGNEVSTRTTAFVYNTAGDVETIITPSGAEQTYTYDARGRLVGMASPSATMRYEIDDTNTQYRVISAPNVFADYSFDANGRLTDINVPSALGISYALNYDSRGNLISLTDNLVDSVRELRAQYSPQGWVTGMSISDFNDGLVTSFAYDTTGNLISVTDPLGNVTRNTVDGAGQVTQISLPMGERIAYAYDLAGNLIAVTDANGNTSQFSYDGVSQLRLLTNPNGQVTRFDYDTANNLIARTDAWENTEQYTYDAAGRLVTFADARIVADDIVDNVTSTYTYDVDGALLSELTFLNETTFTYNPQGEVVTVVRSDEREFLYGRDRDGRITSITDPLANTTSYAYDRQGNLVRISNAQGLLTLFEWRGRRLSAYTFNGERLLYQPDEFGRLNNLINTSDTQAERLGVTYDANGNITSITRRMVDPMFAPYVYTYDYDANGRLIRYSLPISEGAYTYEYDGNGNIIAITDPLGALTSYTYDRVGNLTSITSPQEQTTRYAYDAVGNITRVEMPSGVVMTYTYDERNQLSQATETQPDSDTERTYIFAYDDPRNVIRFTDPAGRETSYAYDDFGNVTDIVQTGLADADTDAPRITTAYTYDDADNLTSITFDDGRTLTLTYNALGQRVRYIDAENNSWSYGYDDAGNLVQVGDPLGFFTSYEWDNWNRLTQFLYGRNDEPVVFGYTRTQLSSVRLPDNQIDADATFPRRETVGYTLDALGNLLAIIHDEGLTTTYQRDDLGRVLTIINPIEENTQNEAVALSLTYDGALQTISIGERILQTRTYDESGNLTGLTNQDGTQITLTYDALGSLVGYALDDTLAVDYAYDPLTRTLTERDAGELGVTNIAYDSFDRPVQVTFDDGAFIDVAYDGSGNRASVRRSNDVVTDYAYDGRGYILSIRHTDIANDVALDGFEYEYDAVGNLTRVNRRNEWSILYGYDDAGQLVSERWLDAENQLVYDVAYRYDNVGNRVEKIERVDTNPPERTLYIYNGENQLISEEQGTTLSAGQDGALLPTPQAGLPIVLFGVLLMPSLWWARGKRRRLMLVFVGSVMLMPTMLIFAQDDADSEAIRTIVYAYDVAGNLISETADDGSSVITYEYDVFNRLVRMTSTDTTSDVSSQTTAITYDDLGRVVRVVSGDYDRRYLYDAFGRLAVEDGDGTRLLYYGVDSDDTLRVTGADSAVWTLDNALGNVQMFVDDDRQLMDSEGESFRYNAFGELVNPLADTETVFSLTDRNTLEQIQLPHTDIVILGVRAYHPRIGRFIQRDPVRHDPRGNLYTYVYNNPVTFSDLRGTTPDTIQRTLEGLSANAPVIDPQALIMRPTLPQLLDMPLNIGTGNNAEDDNGLTVAQAQAVESQRLADLSLLTQFGVNETVVTIDPFACDVFVRAFNAQPETYIDERETNRQAFAERFDPVHGWIPPQTPEPVGGNPLHTLTTLAPFLTDAGQLSVLDGCAPLLTLPAVDVPNPTAFYDALDAIYAETVDRQPALYNALLAEMLPLENLPLDNRLPEGWSTALTVPELIPLGATSVSALQSQTTALIDLLLFPLASETEPLINWQTQYSTEPLNQPTMLEVGQP